MNQVALIQLENALNIAARGRWLFSHFENPTRSESDIADDRVFVGVNHREMLIAFGVVTMRRPVLSIAPFAR